MAIALIQHAEQDQASGTSIVKLFPSTVTLGDLLVVTVFNVAQAGAAFSCSDSQGSYAPLTEQTYVGTISCQTFWRLATATGANTVTVSGLVSAVAALQIAEFSGVKVVDVSAFASGVGNAQDSGAATTGQPIELLFGYTAFTGSLGVVLTVSPGAGFTLIASSISVQSTAAGFITEYQITSVAGAYDATSTTTVGKSNSVNYGTQLVAFYDNILQGAGVATGFSDASAIPSGKAALIGSAVAGCAPSSTLAGSGALSGTVVAVAASSSALAGAGSMVGSSVGLSAPSATSSGKGALLGLSMTLSVVMKNDPFVDFFVADFFTVAAVSFDFKIASISLDVKVA